MKTSKRIATLGATIGTVAVLLAMSGVLSPVLAATPAATVTTTTTTTTTTTSTSSSSAVTGLSVGQVITITSTQGHYRVVGDKSENGTASGTMTFTVTGKFAGGYSLSITTGVLSVNGTAYAVSQGSAEMGPYAHHMVGQGTVGPVIAPAGSTATGAFLMSATARGTFGGEYATVSIDLQSRTTEYLISLVCTIQG